MSSRLWHGHARMTWHSVYVVQCVRNFWSNRKYLLSNVFLGPMKVCAIMARCELASKTAPRHEGKAGMAREKNIGFTACRNAGI